MTKDFNKEVASNYKSLERLVNDSILEWDEIEEVYAILPFESIEQLAKYQKHASRHQELHDIEAISNAVNCNKGLSYVDWSIDDITSDDDMLELIGDYEDWIDESLFNGAMVALVIIEHIKDSIETVEVFDKAFSRLRFDIREIYKEAKIGILSYLLYKEEYHIEEIQSDLFKRLFNIAE